MLEKKETKIDKLKNRLYSKEFEEKTPRIGEFEKKEYQVKEGWMSEEPPISPSKRRKIMKRRINFKKILIASIAFFIISAGIAFFMIRNGSNVFSLKNVDINISAPVSVKGGEGFTVNLNITNRNETAMEFADLIVEYPDGSYTSFDSKKKLTRVRESLGRIAPNGTVKKILPLVLFGSGNSKKNIKFTIEARFVGSSAILDKTKEYEILLSSSPVNLSVDVPKKIGTKQEFEMVVNLGSNTNNTLKNMFLKIDYPSGFTFNGATPSPVLGKNIWKIGDMQSTDKRIIKIRGVIDGQEDVKKIFTFSVGSKNSQNENSLGTVYNSASEQISITKPFLGLKVLLNGVEMPEYVSRGNKTLRFDILWNSNSLVKTTDGDIEAKLDGGIVKRFAVSPGRGGFYRSLDNTIIWNNRTGNNSLSVIEPGASGKVGFTLQPLQSLVDKNDRVFKNPEITVTIKANGNQTTGASTVSKRSSSVSRKIKIESNLKVVPRAVYYTGPFSNTGLLPPVVNKETTYTVILSVTNTSNKISSAIVKTTLPTYVRWLGMVSPVNEDIKFNNVDGSIVWNVGSVDVGTGFIKGAREVAFKVGLTPSASQIGRVPLLTGGIIISGKDTFTGTVLEYNEKGLDINLPSDPSFTINQASVKAE